MLCRIDSSHLSPAKGGVLASALPLIIRPRSCQVYALIWRLYTRTSVRYTSTYNNNFCLLKIHDSSGWAENLNKRNGLRRQPVQPLNHSDAQCAAIAPSPAATTTWRKGVARTSPAAKSPGMEVSIR